jgi:hypothetical protein
MKNGVEARIRILEARVALLEPAVPRGFELADSRTRADLSAEQLARTLRRARTAALAYMLASFLFAALVFAFVR